MLGFLSRGFAHKCKALMKHPHYCKLFCPLCYDEAQAVLEAGVNYYKLYIMEQSYLIDKEDLHKKYKLFQKVLHPDVLRSNGITNPNYSKFLSEAYQTLSCDVQRGKYLLKLHNENVEDFAMDDIEFLEEQISKRETLQQQGARAAKKILREVQKDEEELKKCIDKGFKQENWMAIREALSKLSFLQKLEEEAKDLEEL
ncbi:HSCB [Blepharisma stoltei]|uniref:Co-chaperone HscB C-terminal oligomerisation domain-containing protein n=1 Tax=Blepharisma stoltei TaxID=1481888 RepID=A0AAU9J398_9CILI|nr:unnamed protein product [Blepharisma stoltei]